MRFGTVALFGRTNVGKSTFLNAVLEHDLAIVSALPQTTRDALLGVVTRPDVQLAFVDTPGIHRPKSELGRRMNHAAREAARTTDAILFMTDLGGHPPGTKPKDPIAPEDRELLKDLPKDGGERVVLGINKVDTLRDKGRLLPLLSAFQEAYPFKALVPLSARTGDGVDRVINELIAVLPEAPAAYPADTLTDRPASFFVREFVREQVLAATRGEVPHAVAVSIDRYEEGRVARIAATLHVEKVGQRKILVGEGGLTLRDIGTNARKRIEELLGQRVHLELFVRVTPKWKDVPRQLADLGYMGSTKRGENR
ncbi:MAG TPA: GTPase Era [Polyangiaceae bacterium]|nr:GTPase Era [Polyangiaceae bacterium]